MFCNHLLRLLLSLPTSFLSLATEGEPAILGQEKEGNLVLGTIGQEKVGSRVLGLMTGGQGKVGNQAIITMTGQEKVGNLIIIMTMTLRVGTRDLRLIKEMCCYLITLLWFALACLHKIENRQ